MKRKVFMISFGCTMFLLFCTVTSFRIEELLIPEVTMTTPAPLRDFPGRYRIPADYISVNEKGEEGIWSIQEETNIWGEKEYRVTFTERCVVEKTENGVIINIGNKIVEDALRPLKDGQVVKEAEK